MTLKIRFVCATRANPETFHTGTALGRSLALYRAYSFVELRLFTNNSAGLSSIYNRTLREAAADPAILIFIHDDVYLCDFFWPQHLLDALSSFDVVGLAGNKRRVANQPAWAFIDNKFTWDTSENLSGTVGHGAGFPSQSLGFYGAPRQQVMLLDGVFLAARSETLVSNGVFFDERFDFHFYDMDFCRQLERKNLRMGTCMVSVVHESGGGFNTPKWQSAYRKYLDKWES
jgi:GT2 family glycosyltransferase